MNLPAQIALMTVPQEFTRLCNARLSAEYGDDCLPIVDGGAPTRWESTSYRGNHYVEVYIVKDNRCVALNRQLVSTVLGALAALVLCGTNPSALVSFRVVESEAW